MDLLANMSDTQRQTGLHGLEGLNLAVIVVTEQQRLLKRRQKQSDDTPELLIDVRGIE